MLNSHLIKWLLALLLLRTLLSVFVGKEPQQSKKSLLFGLFFIVWAYFYWILGSVFSFNSSVLMACLALLPSFILFLKPQKNTKFFKLPRFSIESYIFWTVLILALLLRHFFPQLDNYEKYSDMALMQSLILDSSFPPMDRWLSGYALNYYYFTHLLFVPLIQILNIPIEFAMNLITSTVAALLCSTSYDLLKFYAAKLSTRLISVFLVFFAGNWEWVRWATKMHDYKGGFNWANSSKAIPGVITEFPYFSFLLGDMHAHYIALLFVPITVYIWMQSQRHLNNPHAQQSKILLYFLAPLMTGVHYMANSWQMPFVIILCLYAFHKHIKYLIIHLFLAFFYFIYFFALYEAPGKTGLFYVEKALRSPWPDFMLHWGPFSFILLVFFAFYVKNISSSQLLELKHKKITLLLLLASLLVGGFVLGWVAATLITIILFLIRNRVFQNLGQSWHKAILLLSLLTILGCEFISVDATLESLRLNTVFKFYYLAWWGLAVSVPVFIERSQLLNKKRYLLTLCLGALISLYYPIRASAQRVTQNIDKPLTLNGMRNWETSYPGQAEAVVWLRQHTHAQDIIWELMGGADHSFAKFSTFSGRPSVFGWYTHQVTWRKNGKNLFIARLSDFINLNKNPSKEQCNAFLQKYRVKWIIVSAKEKEIYSQSLQNVLSTYPLAFSNGHVSIYKAAF
ncbi:MAG TPA: DUF2298 domain-containing protein [Oligoflexia bacterium]|nr:DUF2298 domain-containing protein [Oligoflexia bacterium]HMR25584.1 DUF2298 domain-containing protein [Oligoflexia bacterium]